MAIIWLQLPENMKGITEFAVHGVIECVDEAGNKYIQRAEESGKAAQFYSVYAYQFLPAIPTLCIADCTDELTAIWLKNTLTECLNRLEPFPQFKKESSMSSKFEDYIITETFQTYDAGVYSAYKTDALKKFGLSFNHQMLIQKRPPEHCNIVVNSQRYHCDLYDPKAYLFISTDVYRQSNRQEKFTILLHGSGNVRIDSNSSRQSFFFQNDEDVIYFLNS